VASGSTIRNAAHGGDRPRHYKELQIWQKAMAMTKMIYKLTDNFPDRERYGLISQMRRAAVSVPSNIAEGQARQGTREYLQFLSHAGGSLAELETQLLLSEDLGFAKRQETMRIGEAIAEMQKMLAAIRRKLSSLQPLATSH